MKVLVMWNWRYTLKNYLRNYDLFMELKSTLNFIIIQFPIQTYLYVLFMLFPSQYYQMRKIKNTMQHTGISQI